MAWFFVVLVAAVQDVDHPVRFEAAVLSAPPVVQPGDRFGEDLDVHGSWIAAGSRRDGDLGPDSGSAFVLDRLTGGWNRVNAPDGAAFDEFGSSVAVHGDRLAVAAIGDDNSSGTDVGSVYVFAHDGAHWQFQAKLLPSPGASSFGRALDLDGDRIAVGRSGPAAVDVFRFDGSSWVPEQVLTPITPSCYYTDFGASLQLVGDRLVVGAPKEELYCGFRQGNVYVFEHDGSAWNQIGRFDPLAIDGIVPHASFGVDVSIWHDTVFVGSKAHYGYVYREWPSGWRREHVFFGVSLAFDIGRYGVAVPDEVLTLAGSNTVDSLERYRRVTSGDWTFRGELRSSSGIASFGPPVTDGCAVAALADVGEPAPGIVVFTLPDRAIDGSTYCTAKTSSLGCVPFVTFEGIPSTSCPEPFLVEARQALPQEPGLLLYGYARANLDFHGGKLCVKPPFVRLLETKGPGAGGLPPCTGVLRRDVNPPIQSGGDPRLTVGQTVHAQWLQRDPNDVTGHGDSLTDAARFVIEP